MAYTEIFKDYKLNQELAIELNMFQTLYYELTHFLEYTPQGRVICWDGKVFDSSGKSNDNRSCIVPITQNIRNNIRKIELIKTLRECILQWISEMNLDELEGINSILNRAIKRIDKKIDKR